MRKNKNRGKLTKSSAEKDVDYLELSFVTVGIHDGTTALEDSLAASNKVQHIFTINPAVLLLGIYSNEMKIYIHTKTCNVNVYSGFIDNHQKLEKNPNVLQ